MEVDLLSVAIDGPAGSGKSSVAKAVARRLSLVHVDTGAMYRALTWSAMQQGVDLDDGPALARSLAALDLRWVDGVFHVGAEPAPSALREEAVTAEVSRVAAHGPVRAEMQRRQRQLSWECPEGVVMEGRDIGSVVLPLAPCKIYLDASVEERARRRAKQEGKSLEATDLEAVARDIERRDLLDSQRKESPLLVSPDAHVVDTTAMSIEEVIDRCVALAEVSRPKAASDEEMEGYRYQHGHYHAFRRFLYWALTTFFGFRIRGAGHERVATGLIYACNHVSWWDPPVIGATIDREVHFLAKKELFWGPLGWFISLFNAFPIDRRGFDATAFARARALLEGGGNLLIFPEGTRRPVGNPGPVKKGLGILAVETGQPYVPCFVEGTPGLFKPPFGHPRVRAWMGPPTRLHALEYLRRDLSDRAIQTRVSQLYLAQLRAFYHRAEAERG